MLINCPECELMVSDKAYSCPHCGYPFRQSQKRRESAKRKRLPNGFGQISEIKGKNLRKPYRVMVPAGKSPTGRPISKLLSPVAYFKTYNEAYQALVEYNKSPYDVSRDVTFSEFYKTWYDYYSPKVKNPATLRQYKSSFSHLTPLYKYKLSAIRTYHLRTAIETAPVSNQLKDKMKALCNMMFDLALERELVARNYAREFNLGISRESDAPIHKAFTNEEMRWLIRNINKPTVFATVVQCYMGWRPDEVLSIKWSDVDFEQNIITGGSKTKAGKDRVVPIHPYLMGLILDKYNSKGDHEYLIWGIGREKDPKKKIRYDSYRDSFVRLMTDHKPHDGRVQFTTMAKEYNMDEYAIKYILGHQIKDLTERVYTKRTLEWLRNEISKIPSGEIFGFENISQKEKSLFSS